jgi:hypothetical protein
MGRWEKGTPSDEDMGRYRRMFECFVTEQMSLVQLYEHMEIDLAFRDYVLTEVWLRDLKLGER